MMKQSRDERIKTKYPTYGSELAAIHKGGAEAEAYSELRALAKRLADESFA